MDSSAWRDSLISCGCRGDGDVKDEPAVKRSGNVSLYTGVFRTFIAASAFVDLSLHSFPSAAVTTVATVLQYVYFFSDITFSELFRQHWVFSGKWKKEKGMKETIQAFITLSSFEIFFFYYLLQAGISLILLPLQHPPLPKSGPA